MTGRDDGADAYEWAPARTLVAAAPYLPLVLIDGTGDVWVRDYQDGVDCYWLSGGPPSDAREEACSYAEIKSRYGISTWILSQKSPPCDGDSCSPEAAHAAD